MKNYMFKFLTAVLIVNLMGCGNSQKNSHDSSKIDKASNQTLTNKTNMITQKITPCLWVETTDAKAVVDYYLSIFKDGKMKKYHQYKNPPEAN